nr:MAG TPA: hypothetical protein [Caudoviricetes sp.]
MIGGIFILIFKYGENSCQGMLLTSPNEPRDVAKGCVLFW